MGAAGQVPPARFPPERYRSGHNGADSKSDGRVIPARGFESHPLRHSVCSESRGRAPAPQLCVAGAFHGALCSLRAVEKAFAVGFMENLRWVSQLGTRTLSGALVTGDFASEKSNPRDLRVAHARGGGCRSTRGMDSAMQAQRGAEAAQMVSAGCTRLGSSSVPARTPMMCGRASAAVNSGVPQCGQKRRRTTLPLSATERWVWVSPRTAKVSVGKKTLTVPLPAPRYWQTRHQHTRVIFGSALLS